MKLRISLIFYVIFLSAGLQAQERYPVSWNYNNQSFTEFVTLAEARLPVRFFYKDEWISDLVLADYRGCKNLSCILENLFRGRSLFYTIDENGNVIITKDFAMVVRDKTQKEERKFVANSAYTDSLEKLRKTEILYLEIGKRADANLPGNVVVSGYITDSETGEALPGVTVFIQRLSAGAVTNANGYYSVSLPRGSHLIQFSFIGMRETKVNLRLNGPGEMNLNMKSVLIPLKETVVTADRNVVLQRFETGVEKISVPSLKMLPAFLGEPDLIKNLLLVTGVQSIGEGAAGFNVRGGSADQNLILLNGAPVYNTSHFFGFFSAVNSDIIKDVTLYKGGMPARFGGRISSVLDIATTDGNKKEFSGNAGISPVTAHVMVEGPLIKDTLSYLLAGRATYSNWLFGIIDSYNLKNSKASFYDLNGKLTYNPDRNNRLDLSAYISHDMFGFVTNTIYNYNNRILGINWKHFYNSRFFSLFSLNNSFYRYDIEQNDIPSEEYILTYKINTTSLKGDFNLYRGLHELNFGIEMIYNSLLPGSYMPASDSSIFMPHMIERERDLEGAIYLDEKFKITEYLSVNAGVRFSSFFLFGPRTQYLYDPNFSKSSSTITDTIFYTSGQLITKYGGLEPRASVNLRIADNSSVKVNYNRTRQYIHLLTNSTSISPTDTWKMCDNYLKPEIGDQYAIGYYQMLFRKKVETSVELYYKDIRNMIDFKGGTSLAMLRNIEQDLINVRGKAYGIELSLKKTEGKFRYNIGYTYARTFVKSTGKFRDDVINEGKWYPANWDKPNDLVITMNYLFSRRISFSANYTYSTGRPITYPLSKYKFNDIMLIHYSERNKYRIPYYSRLDISLKINGNLKIKTIAHPYWTVSLYNALARANVYSVYFVKRYDNIRGYQLSVFGTAIPSVTFGFDF
ncbi:MAG: TonB-dependent receptor [Bacteroidia bacterium]|nr:TonB-dependent receptor [Bacteroidia bacterium]